MTGFGGNDIQKVLDELPHKNIRLVAPFAYVGEGWANIITVLIRQMSEEARRANPEAGLVIEQVKEKYGGLRFYWWLDHELENIPGVGQVQQGPLLIDETYETLGALAEFAEKLSCVTCEITGKPGKIRDMNGWFTCLCDEEYERVSGITLPKGEGCNDEDHS